MCVCVCVCVCARARARACASPCKRLCKGGVGLGIGQPAAHRRWKICQFKMRDVSVPVSVLCLCPSTYWDVPLFFPLPFFFSFFSSLRVMPCGLAGAGADRSRVLVQDPHEKRKSHHIEKESTRANLLALYARNGRTHVCMAILPLRPSSACVSCGICLLQFTSSIALLARPLAPSLRRAPRSSTCMCQNRVARASSTC